MSTTKGRPTIPNSLPVYRQDACDDGGFEEVNLEDSSNLTSASNLASEAVTPVNDFSDFNKQFPMGGTDCPPARDVTRSPQVRGPIRSRSVGCYPTHVAGGLSGFSSSGSTEASTFNPLRKSSEGDTSRPGWMLATTTEEEEEDVLTGMASAPDLGVINLTPLLRTRTPSLVDELLIEIYARFGDTGSCGSSTSAIARAAGDGSLCRTSSTASRASASGSPDSDCLTEYSTTSEPGEPLRRGFGPAKAGSGDHTPSSSSLQRRDSQRRQKLRERGEWHKIIRGV